MTVQLGAFLRTTLPLGLDALADYDSRRYHSLWLPDHMVSFWPDSIWTPEFTDLAVVSRPNSRDERRRTTSKRSRRSACAPANTATSSTPR
jgi:hypothetical protein